MCIRDRAYVDHQSALESTKLYITECNQVPSYMKQYLGDTVTVVKKQKKKKRKEFKKSNEKKWNKFIMESQGS